MSSLHALFGKKKESPSEETKTESASAAEPQPAAPKDTGEVREGGTHIAPRPEGIFGRKTAASHAPAKEAADSSSEQATAPEPVPAKPASSLTGLKFAKPPATPNVSAPSDDLSGLDLGSLANLEDDGIAPTRQREANRFLDHIDAVAPTRELPDDLEKSQKQFVDLLDGVYDVLNEPDIAGSVIKNIMIELKSNPQYINKDPKKSLVAPDDVRTWIRIMRETMGLATT